MTVALCWMLGTFGAFWLSGHAKEVQNPVDLCLFIFSSIALFAAGYAIRIHHSTPPQMPDGDGVDQLRRVRYLILLGASYQVALSLYQLGEFGATGAGNIWASIKNPAGGYLNKLEVYEIQQSEVGGTTMELLLTLLGVLGTILVPILVIYWRRLSLILRSAGVTGVTLTIAHYLYIGTLKGIGDTVIMVAAGLAIVSAMSGRQIRNRSHRGPAMALAALSFTIFLSYMVYNQASRASEFGTSKYVTVSPAVEAVAGREIASGIAATVHYPTHGYLGLAHNLDTPFSWSYGLGSSRIAFAFAERYTNLDLDTNSTYPERTEMRTGWPALMRWSTIYPWLASDLTFPGAALFMGLIGWLFAKFWMEAAFSRRILSMLIFTQLCQLIAYVPANNQLGLSGPSAVGMLTLVLFYAASRIWRATDRNLPATFPTTISTSPAGSSHASVY
jgi:hypothetical protein